MNKEERLNFLKDRLEFRNKVFREWFFVDKTIIQDYEKFVKKTKEIEKELKAIGEKNE